MKLSPPKKMTFYLAVALWAGGLLAPWIPALKDMMVMGGLSVGYVLAIIGGLVLILGNAMDGM